MVSTGTFRTLHRTEFGTFCIQGGSSLVRPSSFPTVVLRDWRRRTLPRRQRHDHHRHPVDRAQPRLLSGRGRTQQRRGLPANRDRRPRRRIIRWPHRVPHHQRHIRCGQRCDRARTRPAGATAHAAAVGPVGVGLPIQSHGCAWLRSKGQPDSGSHSIGRRTVDAVHRHPPPSADWPPCWDRPLPVSWYR